MHRTISVSGDWHLGEGDQHALALYFRHLEKTKPHTVVLLGDIIDCVELHKSQQGARVPVVRGRGTLQLGEEIVLGRRVLGKLRATLPQAEIIYLEGNHEARYPRYLARQSPEAYGHLPTIPDLLGLDELGIKWQAYGVPLKIANWWFTHGTKCGIHVCRTLVQEYMSNVIMGHTHRLKSYSHTTPYGETFTGIEAAHLRDPRACYLANEWGQWQQGWIELTELRPNHYGHTLCPIDLVTRNAVVGSGDVVDEASKGLFSAIKAASRTIVARRKADVERALFGNLFTDPE